MTRSALLLRYVLPLIVLLGLAGFADFLDGRQDKLVSAAWHGDLFKVKFWMALGAKADVSRHGAPPLVAAAWAGNTDLVTFLLDKGASVNGQDKCGNTALSLAAGRGHLSIVQSLLSRGADPNIRGEGSPLWNAQSREDTQMIEVLKAAGASRESLSNPAPARR